MRLPVVRWVRCTALVLGLVACSCEVDLIDDVGFQIWCGETLCNWTLEEGAIERVSTWHDHDYGVELIGAPVVLSQRSQASADCTVIETVSSIEASAEVFVEVDVEGDGVIDARLPIEASDGYQSRTQKLELGVAMETVYSIRKSELGRAIFARLRVSRDCRRDLVRPR